MINWTSAYFPERYFPVRYFSEYFPIIPIVVPPIVGVVQSGRIPVHLFGNNEKYDALGIASEAELEMAELKLSEMLAAKLKDTLVQNDALLKANKSLLTVVDEIKGATIVPTPPEKPELPKWKKDMLAARLEQARLVKSENKRIAEEKHQAKLDNLAKARKKHLRNLKKARKP